MKLAAALLSTFGLTLAPALAGDALPYATVGDWEVLVDTSVAGCFMLATWTKGDVMRLGFDNSNKNGYVMIANPAWRSVEYGKEYKLSMEFDGGTPWTGTFRATKLGDLTVLANSFKDPEFLRDFGAKQRVAIYYDGKLVTTLPLTGSFAAMESLIECQTKVDAIANTPAAPSDPFSGGSKTRPAADPFSSR